MDRNDALDALAALGQGTRLDVFRLLVETGGEGALAGEIAERLDVRRNTLSTHLAILHRAGLVTQRREGQAVRYAADLPGMGALLAFLMQDCCGGRPELCRPAIDGVLRP